MRRLLAATGPAVAGAGSERLAASGGSPVVPAAAVLALLLAVAVRCRAGRR